MSTATSGGMAFGYARVSTTQQDEALQRDALEAAGVDRIFVDHASGVTDSRPALDDMLGQLRPGDAVVIWRLDRLGRSLRHLIDLVAELELRGVGLRSLTESIDTSTPGGKLIFHVFGALAEFERDLIRQRTQAGLIAARARGRVGGRPTVDPGEEVNRTGDARVWPTRRGGDRPGPGRESSVGVPGTLVRAAHPRSPSRRRGRHQVVHSDRGPCKSKGWRSAT